MRQALLALSVLGCSGPLLAQEPVTQTGAVELTATIEAIDKTVRLVTLKDRYGQTKTIYCGPEVKRFDELKVGDTVTFRYYESTVFAIRKPGQPSASATPTGPKLVSGKGPRPGGTYAQQQTATVTIEGIDAAVPSVTVLTEDGRTVSLRVEDKRSLIDVKVGDRVEVTFTQAVVITVK
ncbi:MAG TPA: hypothetical protein VFM88_20540 [Vicinamibacteria bacterium]|nr:hypothetical protein [Vicinamibacteria bacterium]